MTRLEELGSEEICQALVLATALHEKSLAAGGAEQVDPLPDLARAVATVRRARARRALATAVACLSLASLLAAALVIAGTHLAAHHPSPVPAARPAIPVALPPPGDTLLSGLPVPPGFTPPRNATYIGGATAVTFENHLRETVDIVGVGPPYVPYTVLARLHAGDTRWVPMLTAEPLIAVRADGRPLAVYFPPSHATTARITERSGSAADGLHSYLASDSETAFQPQAAVAEASDGGMRTVPAVWQGRITVVNLTAGPAHLYRLLPNGATEYAGQIDPGTSMEDGGWRWTVVDSSFRVIGLYTAPPYDSVAVIRPPAASATQRQGSGAGGTAGGSRRALGGPPGGRSG